MNFSNDQIEHHLDSLAAHLEARMYDSNRHNFYLVGIHTGGAWIADAIRARLGNRPPIGYLDISFYRDDFTQRGLNPSVKPNALPFEVDNRHLVLVDDVLMTGRTIRAAMNALFDYGRPASLTLAVMFDVGGRELPIRADICAETLALNPHQRVELRGPSSMTAEILEVGETI